MIEEGAIVLDPVEVLGVLEASLDDVISFQQVTPNTIEVVSLYSKKFGDPGPLHWPTAHQAQILLVPPHS